MAKNRPRSRLAKFIIIGVANAAISFGILNLSFYYFHQTKIISSLIGTTCALGFSFFMNRNFVFMSKTESAKKQIIPFVFVTVTGSLVLLNLVYAVSVAYLNKYGAGLTVALNNATGMSLKQSLVDINLSTAVGAGFALVWNYNGYRLFVFKTRSRTAAEGGLGG